MEHNSADLELQIKQLNREVNRLRRELEREQSFTRRNRISAEANANLSQIVAREKSRLEQYMNLLLGNCPDIIMLFDREGRIVYASESYLRRSNTSAVSLIRGKTCRELLEPVAEDAFLVEIDELFSSVLHDKRRIELEKDIDFEQDGNLRHYDIQLTPMIDDGQSVEGAMAIFYDTTDLTTARDEAERARRIAEQSTRAKSDFLSRMSHEMRTPLNAIIGMSGIARQSEDMERIQYSLGKVSEASQHLLGVINDILDISKIEADKFELRYDEFDFEKMLQRVVNVNNFRADEKKQKFLVHIDYKIPPVLVGDDQRLTQVVSNLLSNAIKFTDEGGTVELDAFLESAEGDVCTIQVDVVDNGIGISADQQARLFGSFEQADGSISRKYGGTGLGLAISKRIIEMMGGTIWVESAIGSGSKFSFKVPMHRAKNTISRVALRPDITWDNLRVLIVDDMPEILEYFEEIMKKRFAITCDVAESGKEALDIIERRGAYDIYFVDWQMPGMNGIELSRKIRESVAGTQSLVIMISSGDWDVIADDAKSAGINRFLPKPLFPSAIADCINECLGVSAAIGDEQTGTDDNFEGFRVLLAEDVEINREIIMTLLEPTGIEIECAENGRIAVEKFAERPGSYDLIFMDVQMPEMDGYEATRCIRALDTPLAAAVPIVAMTANVFREDVEKCLEAGMDAHVGKPIDIDEVIAQLRRYFKNRQV